MLGHELNGHLASWRAADINFISIVEEYLHGWLSRQHYIFHGMGHLPPHYTTNSPIPPPSANFFTLWPFHSKGECFPLAQPISYSYTLSPSLDDVIWLSIACIVCITAVWYKGCSGIRRVTSRTGAGNTITPTLEIEWSAWGGYWSLLLVQGTTAGLLESQWRIRFQICDIVPKTQYP